MMDLHWPKLKQHVYLLAVSLIICFACAPLSKTQVKLTHNYFETITNYPNYYRELNGSIANLTLEARNLESSLKSSDSVRIATLIYSINEYEKGLKLPDSILHQIRYVERYIQDYYLLLPNGFNVYQALKGTTQTITGFFGLGGLVGGILPNNVPGLNPTKSRKIKQHIYTSEDELLRCLKSIKTFVNSYYIPVLEKIGDESIRDFEELLNTINAQTGPIEYYTQHNRMLTEFYRKLFLTKSLASTLASSIDPFIRTEQKLTSSLNERKKIDPETPHLSELVRNIQRIQSMILDLETKKPFY